MMSGMFHSAVFAVMAGVAAQSLADGQSDRAFWVASMVRMVLSVYGDRMVIQRIDFANRKPLGPAWELSPSSGGMPFAHETRRRAAIRPEFPADATLSAKMEEPKSVMMLLVKGNSE